MAKVIKAEMPGHKKVFGNDLKPGKELGDDEKSFREWRNKMRR